MASFQVATNRTSSDVTELQQYVYAPTGADVVEMMKNIKEPAAQVAFVTRLLLAPQVTLSSGTTAEKGGKTGKVKKALNAFVGFRCYYISIPVFKVWPMKKLSNLVGQLWERDPNKSIWSLLAKAWSTMRDQIGKDNVPLDHFFQIICPYLNIPSPNTYLELQGWNLEINDEGSPILSRDPNSESLISSSAGFIDMTLSVEDIISVCQTMGYAQDYVPDRNATSPTFLARSTQGSVQDIRVAARNKRREKRRNARESGAATALRKEIDTVRNAFSDNSFQKHDHNGTGGVSLEFHNRLTELLTDPHALSNIIAQGQLHNSHVAPSQTPASHQLQLSGLYIPADHSAFRLGADENATLPHFDASSI